MDSLEVGQCLEYWNQNITLFHLKIETLYDERMEQLTESRVFGPHITLQYRDHHILEDARYI